MSPHEALIPLETIERKIFIIRGERIMLDSDLAAIYGVETRALNQAIRRNIERFPDDFIFHLTQEEYESLMSQVVISKPGRGGRRKPALAFTEHGALMAANVLNSATAVDASLQVIRAFVRMRNMLASNAELSKKIESLEKKYDAQFKAVFDAIKRLMLPPDRPKGGIGFVETSKNKK